MNNIRKGDTRNTRDTSVNTLASDRCDPGSIPGVGM